MTVRQRIEKLRIAFVPAFWIANVLELFERLAFYGSKAVLAVFLATKVGLDKDASTLTGLFSGVIYSLPIVAGVFVDKYGFRKTLMTCFLMFAIGYFLIGLGGMGFGQPLVGAVGKKGYMVVVLLLTAIGGSLIKPCIVGTVAKTSKPDARALGFSIYYTMVNFGGAIGPILALQVRENFGIEYVLVMSSITTGLLLIGTFLFFKEPESYEGVDVEKRTFGKVFSDMLLVFRNFKFISFLVIFSGFWIMFWQIFYLFPFYIIDVLKYPSFEILETVDAWGVILFTVPLAALVKKWKPIRAMILGFILASLSWLVIGINGTIAASIIGIAIYSLGEATQSPRFYEYVSALAPKSQVGTFMGFAFLPVALGSFMAGPLADWLRHTYLQTDPLRMWLIVSSIGIFSTLLMLIYNSFFGQQTAKE
jgi:POT family proton-dependent oligopeptide transporter